MRQCRCSVLFMYNSISGEKTPVLRIEKFPFLELARNTIMLQHLVIHLSLHQPSSGRSREVKYKEKFQTFSSKSGRGRLRERVAYMRGSKYSDLTGKFLVFWKTFR